MYSALFSEAGSMGIAEHGRKNFNCDWIPDGLFFPRIKNYRNREAIAEGAEELDVVINIIALKNGEWGYLKDEMQKLLFLIHEKKKVIKVIVESGVLTRDELLRCCAEYGKMDIDFMKTSTGYAEKGASVSDVQLMRKHLPPRIKIKASGGIRHYPFAAELIEAGASRLGCSASLQILEEEKLTIPT